MVDILYVDEQESQSREFEASAYDSAEFRESKIVSIKPENSLDETLGIVLESHCRVLITDFKLSEFQPEVEFTGAELVNAVLSRKRDFPCFVATSFATDAALEDIDVNMIFPKQDYLDIDPDKPPQLPFFLRVKKKIDDYEEKRNLIEKRFGELMALREKDDLTADQFEELLNIDGEIEAQIGHNYAVAGHLKGIGNQNFAQLIEKAERLLEEIESNMDAGPSSER